MSNNTNEAIAVETKDVVIVEDTPLLNLSYMKTLCKDEQYEDLCIQIIEYTIISGVLYEYYSMTNDNNNLSVKLCVLLYYHETGVLRHYNPPTGPKKYYNTKAKIFKDFYPSMEDVCKELLIKENPIILNSHIIAKETLNLCKNMILQY